MKVKNIRPQTVRFICKLLQLFSNDVNDGHNDYYSDCYEFCVAGK